MNKKIWCGILVAMAREWDLRTFDKRFFYDRIGPEILELRNGEANIIELGKCDTRTIGWSCYTSGCRDCPETIGDGGVIARFFEEHGFTTKRRNLTFGLNWEIEAVWQSRGGGRMALFLLGKESLVMVGSRNSNSIEKMQTLVQTRKFPWLNNPWSIYQDLFNERNITNI